MQLIRCTAKLLKEMGLKKSDLIEDAPEFSFLGQWHANLTHINRKKCVLFVNDKTLINFIVPDVPRSKIRKLDTMFKEIFRCVLVLEGFKDEIVDQIMSEYSDIQFGKSNNRSVLGTLNDLAFNYEYSILESGGTQNPTIPSIIKQLNRIPMRASKACIFPIKELHKLYETAT